VNAPGFDLANWESQSRKGLLEMVLLGLMMQEERYGYDLVRSAQALLQQRVVEGTVYPLLARLVREEMVTTTWRMGDTAQPRKYYAVTPRGREAFLAMASSWRRLACRLDPWLENLQ
jgi:PadR family transcriptional regulator PadR